MNNNNLSQATNNDVVCEAVGCYARANTKLPVRVRSQKTIYLFLCDNCKPKALLCFTSRHQRIKNRGAIILTEYDKLLEDARTKAEAFKSTAKEYIPKMYCALRNENQNLIPEDARDRIEKDCVKFVRCHRHQH